MNSPQPQPGSISPFIRVLAWILLICIALGAAVTIYGIVTAKSAEASKLAWTGLALILVVAPLFGYAAIKGRAPPWFASRDNL
jgi:hypothetical protein